MYAKMQHTFGVSMIPTRQMFVMLK